MSLDFNVRNERIHCGGSEWLHQHAGSHNGAGGRPPRIHVLLLSPDHFCWWNLNSLTPYLQFYDGPTTNDSLLANVTSSTLGNMAPIVSNGGDMLVRLVSTGVNATYVMEGMAGESMKFCGLHAVVVIYDWACVYVYY